MTAKPNSKPPDFLQIAMEEFAGAFLEGRAGDSNYVRDKAYARYEKERKQYEKFRAEASSN